MFHSISHRNFSVLISTLILGLAIAFAVPWLANSQSLVTHIYPGRPAGLSKWLLSNPLQKTQSQKI